jgi:hypothetical protein
MKIALVTAAKFEDYDLLALKLDELSVIEVIAGTTNAYAMLEKYIQNRPSIKITLAQKGQTSVMRAYNAMREMDNVIIFANGTGNGTKKSRTELSIAYALNKGKNLMIYPYSSKAFDITQDDKYVKIGFKRNVQRASGVETYLSKSEVEEFINELTKIKGQLS